MKEEGGATYRYSGIIIMSLKKPEYVQRIVAATRRYIMMIFEVCLSREIN